MKKVWLFLLLFLFICVISLRFLQGKLGNDLSFIGLSGQVFLEEDFIHPHKINNQDFSARDAIEVMKEKTEVMTFYRDYHENMKDVSDYKWFATVEHIKEKNYFLVIMRESKLESPFICKAQVDDQNHTIIESICGHEQDERPLLFPSEYKNFKH